MSELIVRRATRPWAHNDVVYRLTRDGRRHEECLEILHGFTKKVCTSIWYPAWVPQWPYSSHACSVHHLYHSSWIKQYKSIELRVQILSPDISISIKTGYELDELDCRGSFPASGKRFPHFYSIRTGFVAHPVSCSKCIGDTFCGGKGAGAWSWPLISI
jgi:hypothetical protein